MSKWNDFQKEVYKRNLSWNRQKISAEYQEYKKDPQAYEFPEIKDKIVHAGEVASAIGRDIASVNYAAHNGKSVTDLSGAEWPVHEWLDKESSKYHVPEPVWQTLTATK